MLPWSEEELDSSGDMSVGELQQSAAVIFDDFGFGDLDFSGLSDAYDIGTSGELIEKQVYPQEAVQSGADFSGLSDAFDIGASGELMEKQVYAQEAVESEAEVSMFGRWNEMAGIYEGRCTHSTKGHEVQGFLKRQQEYVAVCEKWNKERIEFLRSEAGKDFSLK